MCIYLFVYTNELNEFNLICNCNSNKYIKIPKKSVKKENAFVEVQRVLAKEQRDGRSGYFKTILVHFNSYNPKG